ncbi:hypothetical protein I317_06518 [Kwoniella heveanensis CBS 569]|nr:hypothetical protein I317_06518 [Kwoniella heveanensis CBS 569]
MPSASPRNMGNLSMQVLSISLLVMSMAVSGLTVPITIASFKANSVGKGGSGNEYENDLRAVGVWDEYGRYHRYEHTTAKLDADIEEDASTSRRESESEPSIMTSQYQMGQVPMPIPIQGQRTESQGWLTRWLSMGGEGSLTIHLDGSSDESQPTNISLPHRPAAFPAHVINPLPLSGYVTPFASLLNTTTPLLQGDDLNEAALLSSIPELACLPPRSPVGRPSSPPDVGGGNRKGDKKVVKIALVERGGCDFATKIRAAQERGAGAVVVGDSVARRGESDEEGRRRESLITMFSPEDTDTISIPSVFISRASFLLLRDLLNNQTDSGRADGPGLWIDLSEGSDETGALTSLLSFALLMPTLFLLATIAIHRIRVARQREADRAPPMIVLSLPERVWTPDIVWEKDDSSSDRSVNMDEGDAQDNAEVGAGDAGPENNGIKDHQASSSTNDETGDAKNTSSSSVDDRSFHHPPPPISPHEVRTPPALTIDVPDPIAAPPPSSSITASAGGIGPSKRKARVKRQYFSKDECAICMDSFARGDIVRILPCGHVFHKDECDEWLIKWRKLCPTCRADVTLPPGGNIQGSTLTPVTHVSPPSDHPLQGTSDESALELDGSGYQADQGRTWGRGIRSWAALFRDARERMFGQASEAEGESGERTPLVPRLRESSTSFSSEISHSRQGV